MKDHKKVALSNKHKEKKKSSHSLCQRVCEGFFFGAGQVMAQALTRIVFVERSTWHPINFAPLINFCHCDFPSVTVGDTVASLQTAYCTIVELK